jgi:ABC-type glutathione transport system ATPase component
VAHEFFKPVPVIARKLRTLLDVGLGYIRLGQSATTLSGGEAQRVKLSLELSKRDTGRTLFILDEPTTGLHFQDIELLLTVLHRLRDDGNTVVIIEHNLDVIKTADWVIDLGPEGGDGGGEILAIGTPEDIAANPKSVTGPYLAPLLGMTPVTGGGRVTKLAVEAKTVLKVNASADTKTNAKAVPKTTESIKALVKTAKETPLKPPAKKPVALKKSK